MPYSKIELGPGVPPSIGLFVRERVEPYLRDVRLMLEYPKRDGEPGFNLTAASILCSVIGGLARVFYNTEKGDGDSFKTTAKRYPLANEPVEAIRDDTTFADALYDVFRCNLVHSLGLNMERDKNTGRYAVEMLASRTVVVRHGPLPMTEKMLAELDDSNARSSPLRPTLSSDGGTIKLCVDSLYSGVRDLVRNLAEDTALQTGAVAVLEPWFKSQSVHSAHVMDLTSSPAVLVSVVTPAAQ